MAELNPQLENEIIQLLATHAGQPMDYVAVFMLLNTVAGGHYEERFSESAVRDTLKHLLGTGRIEARDAEDIHLIEVIPGVTSCTFKLPS